MRFGAQGYELKRSIANDSEYFRHNNPTFGQYQTSNVLIAPSTHTPPQYSVEVRFLTHISPGEDSNMK